LKGSSRAAGIGIAEAIRTGLSASSARSGACQRKTCIAPRVKLIVAP
jgi:hypothetical protein